MSKLPEQNNAVLEMIAVVDSRTNRFQVNKVAVTATNDGGIAKNAGDFENNDDDEVEDDEDDFETGNLLSKGSSDIVHDTKYGKSFRLMTREALPREDNYRHVMSLQAALRPTLDDLHDATLTSSNKPSTTVQFDDEQFDSANGRGIGGGVSGYGNGCGGIGGGSGLGGINGQYTSAADGKAGVGGSSGQLKFGWIKGVFVRCLLNIWGVMLFLRLSWVVAQVGILEAIILILTTTVVTIITALSMSAISTNGLIKGGGTYYMISRSLGPEFGGSIGLIFSLANAVACALYVVGFCESMNDLLAIYDLQLIDGGIQDVRIMGSITLLLLMCIVVIGMEWEAKAQIGLLVILLAAILDFLIGSVMGPKNNSDRAKGFVGYNYTLLKENFYSDYRYSDSSNHNFFSVFSIFFPAATGILAGANISGDLKDPQKSIPKGTILAIIVTSVSYIVIAIICGATVMRQASGLFPQIECSSADTCKYGLHNNKQIVALVSWQEGLIYAGCFAATLSSALASLVSAPKVFQALCKDKLYPAIEWFGRGYGPNNEPVRGYILTFVIAVAFVLIGQLDLIAPLISNFFLAAYTLINFSTFHASLTKPVGWRPTFKYYNMWLSLIGTVLCVIIMFLISWVTALITFAALFSLYLIVSYRKPDVNWGSTTQAQAFKNAIVSVQQLNNVEEHVKNYRPQILLLSGFPPSRQPLVDFAYTLTKNISMLICGQISYDRISQNSVNALHQKSNQWLIAHKTKAFYTLVDDMTFLQGAKALLQASGMGKLRPNILMMGYKSDWRTCPRKDLVSYFDVLHKALDMYLSVTILRLQNGFEVQKMTTVPTTNTTTTTTTPNSEEYPETENGKVTKTETKKHSIERNNSANSMMGRNRSFSQASCNGGSTAELAAGGGGRVTVSATDQRRTSTFTTMTNKIADPYADQFLQKQKKGTIDVWWLYDDGGLTLLLPYILSTRQNWQDSRLRVFAIANKTAESEFEHRNMANLLAKFRIDYLDLTILPDITKKPQEKTRKQFEALIADFVETNDQNVVDDCKQTTVKKDNKDAIISEAELLSVQDKTNRNLRIKELLEEHSKDATLIVMTLPVPRKNVVSAPLYMAWIEMFSRDMPPFLFVRGNQTSVLTFYS